ncbi:MAG: glycosyltransferase [Candidatus Omnitrophota bacterium]
MVSVIIPTLNSGSHLAAGLKSLSVQDYAPIEIIVVVNKAGAVADLRQVFPGIIWIENKTNLGFAAANNQGAAAAEGEYLLFLNDDVEVEPDFLTKLMKRTEEEPAVGICQSKILLMQDHTLLDTAGSFFTFCGFLQHLGHREKDLGQYDKLKEIFSPKGACMLVRREAIQKAGLFDEDFFAFFEETDLAWRVWLAGFRVELVSDSRVYHKVGATATKLPSAFIDYHSFKNRICALIKNLEFKNLLLILPIHIFLCLGLGFLYLVSLRFSNAFSIIQAMLWNIFHLPGTLSKRNYVQKKIRLKSDAEIFAKTRVNFSPAYFSRFLSQYIKSRW